MSHETRAETQVSSRKKQYMIAPTPVAGLQTSALIPSSVNMGLVEQALKDNPNVDYVKTIAPSGIGALAAGLAGGPPSIVVARMDEDHANVLQLSGAGRLIVEEDRPLSYTLPAVLQPTIPNPGVLAPTTSRMTLSFTVQDENNRPLPDAEIYLFGTAFPVQGVTDQDGNVSLTLFGQDVNMVRGLFINPKADYWGLYVPRPALEPDQNNLVTLKPIGQYFPNFPNQQVIGWGQRAMKMDQLPPQFQGQGVKIGVIDSGAAAQTHRNLHPGLFRGGFNVPANSQNGWDDDTVGHGTHCSGIIAGLNIDQGIRGFAPGAELYAYKIFPGGQYSDLISALNDCINQQVDLVNLSLGSDQPSQLVAQKIQQAKDLGVACIIAAGNSGGPVQFPASLPSVLAVAAVGKLGEYPPDSFHGTQIAPPGPNSDGYFSASFTCFGPEVGLCAPGVAILSSVPPNDFAVWDGTSMAAPHITGLAALILAHHPDFQQGGPYSQRNAQRVDRLFEILKQSAQPINLGDPNRTGAGLPDALRAFSNIAAAPQRDGRFGGLDGGMSFGNPGNVAAATDAGGLGASGGAVLSANAPAAAAVLQWLGSVLQQTGVLGNDRAAAQPQRAVMQPASYTPNSGGAAPSSGGDLKAKPSMQQLTAAMKQAGLLD